MGVIKGYRVLFVTFSFLFVNSLVESREFVPVYAWGSQKVTEKIPALHRVSEDSFRDEILERLKANPLIVVFAEETLSPEDFSERDQSGERTYPNLFKLRSTEKTSYLPYVQNPIKALRNLNKEIKEVSIDQYLQNPEIPQSDVILIINLNDAQDQEERFSMLRRHDSIIADIYAKILKQHNDVLAFYTARHISWAGPENIESRKTRSLLQAADEDKSTFFNGNCVIAYVSGKSNYTDLSSANAKPILVTFTFAETCTDDNNIKLTATDATNAITLDLDFVKTTSRYWLLTSFVLTKGTERKISLNPSADVYAPVGFSYHCSNDIYKNVSLASIKIPNFQVQPFVFANTTRFSDSYDCVGFTSIPIWSGLFVTSILLLIMTFGLIMMIDIKTMDRFDDAKGKTITINASE